jgi:SWI/SNF-related matrix-associated actin-dependent regulator 1 of chromatin subfamily A
MIFNDEIGFGKRLCSICASIYFKNEWPLLIVCPASFMQLWREEFVKWIPNFDLTKL